MSLSLVTCLAIATLLGTSAAPVADVFVDIGAADCAAGTGSVSSPVCSIATAIDLASPGDVIYIAPGTYVENVVIGIDLDLIGTGGADVTIVDGNDAGSVVVISNGVTAMIDGLTIRNGRTSVAGGGIRVVGALTLRNSTVTENEAIGGADGGGIGKVPGGGSGPGPTLRIQYCTISNNSSSSGSGGGIAGGLWLENSTVSGNTAPSEGGGGVKFSSGFIRNSTISGNSAIWGGGVYLEAPFLNTRIEHSTITLNVSTGFNPYYGGSGGGVHQRGYMSGDSIFLRSCIVAGNSGGGASPDASGLFEGAYNLIGTGAEGLVGGLLGSLQNPIDAQLGPLQDNGGLTHTHALLAGSPAIDAGNPLIFPVAPSDFQLLDQRGVDRPRGVTSDVGAFESDGAGGNFCNGDGGDQFGCVDCPCMNNNEAGQVGGCLNSIGTSPRLYRTGLASVSAPLDPPLDLAFGVTALPPSTFIILTSGDAVAPTNAANPCFGVGEGVQALAFDGLRCAVLNTRRHGGRSAGTGGLALGYSGWGGLGGPDAGLVHAFGGFSIGDKRYFQAIYRDDPLLVCMRGLNTTQAIEVTFSP